MQTLIPHIQQCLKQFQLPGNWSLYYEVSTTRYTGDDESSITIVALRANEHRREHDEDTYDNTDNLLTKAIAAWQPEHPENWKLTLNDGLRLRWESAANDYIHIQYSDHHMYVTLFESGQY